jgi:hypothetical protein
MRVAKLFLALSCAAATGIDALAAPMTHPFEELEASRRDRIEWDKRAKRDAAEQRRSQGRPPQRRDEGSTATRARNVAAPIDAKLVPATSGNVALPGWGSASVPLAIRPGKDILLRTFFDLAPDCTPRARPEVRVTVGPQHGSVSVRLVAAPASGPAGCSTRNIPASGVFYTPHAGFRGKDSLTLLVIPEGQGKQPTTLDITVQPSPTARPR